MDAETDTIEEKQPKKKEFIGRDLKQSYLYYRNKSPQSSKDSYFFLTKCVEFGKELLPTSSNEKEQTVIHQIYKEACDVLENERLDEVKQTYAYVDFGDSRIPVYKLTATDAGIFEVREEHYERAIEKFKENQYENHLKKLKKADNRIFNMLVKHGVIPRYNPGIEEMQERFMKAELDDMLSDLNV
jgi:hypothetical protein